MHYDAAAEKRCLARKNIYRAEFERGQVSATEMAFRMKQLDEILSANYRNVAPILPEFIPGIVNDLAAKTIEFGILIKPSVIAKAITAGVKIAREHRKDRDWLQFAMDEILAVLDGEMGRKSMS